MALGAAGDEPQGGAGMGAATGDALARRRETVDQRRHGGFVGTLA